MKTVISTSATTRDFPGLATPDATYVYAERRGGSTYTVPLAKPKKRPEK
jgi:hypothetical protein